MPKSFATMLALQALQNACAASFAKCLCRKLCKMPVPQTLQNACADIMPD